MIPFEAATVRAFLASPLQGSITSQRITLSFFLPLDCSVKDMYQLYLSSSL